MHDLLRIAVYAAPPVALDAFHSFDPESFVVATMLADSLVFVDEHGELVPWLAVRWERDTPVSVILDLREGVRFHDGVLLTSRDVVATFAEHQRPGDPTINGKGVFAPIKKVEALGSHRVRIETRFPDAMLLHRLFFASIYPAHLLEKYGREAILEHPIGTGPYELVEWNAREHILLQRNPDHFMGCPQTASLQLPILPQTEWIDAVSRGELDIALNIDAHDAARARNAGLTVQHAAATMSHFFLLANRGPLTDARVRRALDHAIHRDLLVAVAEHGNGVPSASLLSANQLGHDPTAPHYRYSVDRARALLAEAGYPDGFSLRGLVSSTSSVVYQATREFLARVGVHLEADVVPQATWARRVVVDRMSGAATFEGDFAVATIDNPLCHGLFHHYIFLSSHGPFSLTQSEAYDERFFAAATNLDPQAGLEALEDLDRYAHDEALALFTVSPHIYTAARPGVSIPLPASGHFNSAVLRALRKDSSVSPSTGYTHARPKDGDLSKLLDATSHPSVFFGPERSTYEDTAHRRLWDRLMASQSRRSAQNAPMLRELVSSAECKLHLANVLETTSRVGIVGCNDTGRQLFVNEGYRAIVDPDGGALEDLGVAGEGVTGWADIRSAVDADGSWSGAVALERPGHDRTAHLHLSASQATDSHGIALGYTYVFSDFSGAEERVKSLAQRRIMDHVPYGLFTVRPDLTVAPGYSRACDALLGGELAGTPLPRVLGFDTRSAEDLEILVDQVFADILPEDVSLAQLPARVVLDGKVLSLTASVIRDDADVIEGVLFSALDVSALEVAQRELDETQSAIAVLEDRDRFESVATAYLDTLERLVAGLEHPEGQAEARRELHTFKGEFGMYGQREVVEAIHAAEDATTLTAADLLSLREAFALRLEANAHIWRIGDRDKRAIDVEPEALQDLLSDVGSCDSLEALRERVLAFADRAVGKPAFALAGPLGETCQCLAVRLGKRVNFRFEGADLRVPEAHAPLYRTLPHLLRNAIDHGIEPAEGRGSKSIVGTISLRVRKTDEGFELRFSDDGRGIDVDALVRRAVASGALTQDEADGLNDEQRLQLIFLPGLSTAKETTDLSGRGIGMDAVRTVAERLGGSVTLSTRRGEGTTLTVTLPSAGALALVEDAAAA